jgi:sporulation protein YlmC with PRC-barrel domain
MNTPKLTKTLCLTALMAAAPMGVSGTFAQDPSAAPAEKIAPADTAPAEAAPAPAPAPAPPAAAAPAVSTPMAKDVAIGAVVFGSDGKRLGKVDAVDAQPAGTINVIHVHVGGLFGFGGKTVAVPGDKITKTGSTIQVSLTSPEVEALPEVASNKG